MEVSSNPFTDAGLAALAKSPAWPPRSGRPGQSVGARIARTRRSIPRRATAGVVGGLTQRQTSGEGICLRPRRGWG